MGELPVGAGTGPIPAVRIVQEAHHRYAQAFDEKAPEAVAAAFTEAGVLVTSTGNTVASRAGLREFAVAWVASHADVTTRHSCDRHDVTAAPGWIESTCRATVEAVARDGSRSVLLLATYRDTVVLDNGQWRIARREVIPDQTH